MATEDLFILNASILTPYYSIDKFLFSQGYQRG